MEEKIHFEAVDISQVAGEMITFRPLRALSN